MEQTAGAVQTGPSPVHDHLKALMLECPREVVARGKRLLGGSGLDQLTQAHICSLLCYTSACVLHQSTVEAVFHGHEAVRLARGIDGLAGQQLLFDSLVNLGLAAERIGEYEQAIQALQEAHAMPLDWLGRRPREQSLLMNLARLHYARTEYDEALTTFDQAETLSGQAADPFANEELHSWRGMCLMKQGELELAEQSVALAVAIVEGEGRPDLQARSLIFSHMAVLQYLQDEEEEAEAYARRALEVAEEVQDPYGLVMGNLVLACCARSRRRAQQSVALAAAASRAAFDFGYVPLIQEMVWLMGYLYPEASS